MNISHATILNHLCADFSLSIAPYLFSKGGISYQRSCIGLGNPIGLAYTYLAADDQLLFSGYYLISIFIFTNQEPLNLTEKPPTW